MSDALRIAVVGAAGRMGAQVMNRAFEHPRFRVVAALVPPEHVEQELGPQQVVSSTDMRYAFEQADVVIDFSSPDGLREALHHAVESGRPIVSGTTGLGGELQQSLDAAAREIPVLSAANFSVGVNLLEHLVQLASESLDDFDVEIFEAHHRNKVDAPSGTALFLGRAAARARDLDLAEVASFGREGAAGPRDEQEIGFSVLRGGSIVGEHTVYFCGAGERVELTHRASDRGIFALGALRAARWIADQRPGRYTMRDVLFS